MHTQNVEGTERLLSLAVGTMGMVSGFRQGGVGGLLKIAASAMIAKRGLTGHCQLKGLLEPPRDVSGEQQPRRPGAATGAEADKLTEASRMENALEETFPASDPISP